MWLLIARNREPDAPYWPGRRLLAVVDAVLWPLLWGLAFSLAIPAVGLVGPIVAGVALSSALVRLHRALLLNHRYRFTAWRWGRMTAILMLIGFLLKLTTPI